MEKFILLILGLLFFILPIPRTIGIRNILAGILVISSIYAFYQYRISFKEKELKNSLFLLGSLTIWILVETYLISPVQPEFHEILADWLFPIIYFIIGIILSNFIDYKKLLLVLFISLLIHVLYVDLYVLHYYILHHHIINRIAGLTGGPDKSNYLTNILFAFLITEVIFRIRLKKSFLPIDNYFLILTIVITIFSSIVEGMRNGVVALAFLPLAAIYFIYYKNNKFSFKFKIITSLTFIIILLFPAYYNLTHDPRWKTLYQTIPIALNLQKNKNWLYPHLVALPKLSNGNTVSASNYQRIAWDKAGIIEISKHPLGVGYSRNAFRHALELDYNKQKVLKGGIGHSHSSIIDFTLATGIIGTIFWMAFILYLFYLSLKYFKLYNSYFSILLFFNVSGFFTRSFVDSNMRDHMFLMFMFIIGFSFMYMLKEKNDNLPSA